MSAKATIEKFKTLVKKYWFIAIPVHVGTSGMWYGTFFGATKVGLDFVPLLEKTSLPQKYIDPLKKGNLGNHAQALILYKLAGPFRYATTLGVTRSVIRVLRGRGMIK